MDVDADVVEHCVGRGEDGGVGKCSKRPIGRVGLDFFLRKKRSPKAFTEY